MAWRRGQTASIQPKEGSNKSTKFVVPMRGVLEFRSFHYQAIKTQCRRLLSESGRRPSVAYHPPVRGGFTYSYA